MTTIKFNVRKLEEVTVDVDFPIYMMHDTMPDHGQYIVYSRTDADMMETTITKKTSYYREDDIGYEIQRRKTSFAGRAGNDLDYILGKGEFACTAEDFKKVMQDAADFILDAIKGQS